MDNQRCNNSSFPQDFDCCSPIKNQDNTNIVVVIIYSTVLIGGIIGCIYMMFSLYNNSSLSVTTIAIINLVVVHVLFLITVPFRIYYFVTYKWAFGVSFCKIASGAIHCHMYLAFLFYVSILVIRYISYFKRRDKVAFYRLLHAVLASSSVWIVALICVFPLFMSQYGRHNNYKEEECFQFHQELTNEYVSVLNFFVIAVMLAVIFVLFIVQIVILARVTKQLKGAFIARQEFWVQIKSLSFVLVMLVCFAPYHMFRIYYIMNISSCSPDLINYNEICLGITSICCFDLLTFLAKSGDIRSFFFCKGCRSK
ncbi:probable G-protein coupled receptor 141 [Protopterus annectens]|uniref:probable G-protein coupled receptor 141 n=1 Tax=Protopterus annectens TaxID=7888 RepID=UPI001CFA3585|nr:probable G-protein coupled receptor 141 [Protopterus annectens]